MGNIIYDSILNILRKRDDIKPETLAIIMAAIEGKQDKFQNNFEAITDPTVNNDTTEGYEVGSKWYNTIDEEVFICVDATEGEAKWIKTTLNINEAEYSISSTSGTIDLNYNNGTYQKVSLTGTTTFTLSNPNRNFLIIKITNGGAQTITWPTVRWAGGTAPVLTASGTDIVSFYYDGTNYYGDYQTDFKTV